MIVVCYVVAKQSVTKETQSVASVSPKHKPPGKQTITVTIVNSEANWKPPKTTTNIEKQANNGLNNRFSM